MGSTAGPYARIYDLVKEIETRPGVLTASFYSVTPYLDVPEMGSSVVGYTGGDPRRAQGLADEIARAPWDLRYDLQYTPPVA